VPIVVALEALDVGFVAWRVGVAAVAVGAIAVYGVVLLLGRR
jgi:hypothetical protein